MNKMKRDASLTNLVFGCRQNQKSLKKVYYKLRIYFLEIGLFLSKNCTNYSLVKS